MQPSGAENRASGPDLREAHGQKLDLAFAPAPKKPRNRSPMPIGLHPKSGNSHAEAAQTLTCFDLIRGDVPISHPSPTSYAPVRVTVRRQTVRIDVAPHQSQTADIVQPATFSQVVARVVQRSGVHRAGSLGGRPFL